MPWCLSVPEVDLRCGQHSSQRIRTGRRTQRQVKWRREGEKGSVEIVARNAFAQELIWSMEHLMVHSPRNRRVVEDDRIRRMMPRDFPSASKNSACARGKPRCHHLPTTLPEPRSQPERLHRLRNASEEVRMTLLPKGLQWGIGQSLGGMDGFPSCRILTFCLSLQQLVSHFSPPRDPRAHAASDVQPRRDQHLTVNARLQSCS